MEWLAPYHPALVHAPIALLIVGFVFEVVGRLGGADWWRRAATALLILGTLGAGSAYLSGREAGERAEHAAIPEAPIDAHERAATGTLVVAVVAVLLRIGELTVARARPRMVGLLALLAYAAAAVMVGVTGLRGGELVFGHGAGVQVHAPSPSGPGGEQHERP
jgi:uncharacterized membrane protein